VGSIHAHAPDLSDFFFWKNSQKGGRDFRAADPRDVAVWWRVSAPFVRSTIRAALSMRLPRSELRMIDGEMRRQIAPKSQINPSIVLTEG
jgi:hypothetical protein